MEALRLPACATPVAYLFRFRGPRDPPLFVLALAALSDGWRTHPGQGICSDGRPFAGRPPICRPSLSRTQAGSHRFPGDPSYALAPVQDPGRTDDPPPDGVVDA